MLQGLCPRLSGYYEFVADCGSCVSSQGSHRCSFDKIRGIIFFSLRCFFFADWLQQPSLSCFAFFSCEFVKNRFTNAGIGLVRSETLVDGSYQCVRNTTVSIGGWLYRWSMVSGALSPILGSGVLFLMSFDCCCKGERLNSAFVACHFLFQTHQPLVSLLQ